MPQKVNKTPKLSQIQKYKVVQLIQLNPTLTPTIGESGTKKSKTTPKLSQIEKSELKEPWKIKVVKLHD